MWPIDVWCEEYTKQLTEAVNKYPDEYMFPVESVPNVVARMREAFINGTYNKDGRAIKATCKALGIKYTYTAINSYLKG